MHNYTEACALEKPPTFLGARTVFECLMDFPLFLSSYHLFAENRENGTTYIEDKTRSYWDRSAKVSEVRRIQDDASRLVATVQSLAMDFTDACSDDIFVANSPFARAAADQVNFDDIRHEPVDEIHIYNLVEHVPIIGKYFDMKFPFVPYRHNFRVHKEGELYRVEIQTTSVRDLKRIVNKLPDLKARISTQDEKTRRVIPIRAQKQR